MDDLHYFLTNLNKLEELNLKKFNSSELHSMNKKIDDLIKEFKIKLDNNEIDLKNKKSKNIFLEIISKIDDIEQKILPKAELLKSFSKSLV